MNQEQFLEQIYPWIGGQANVGRWQTSGDKLCITVKDRSMVDLASVRRVPGVEAAELGRSRLSITVQAAYQEELHMAKKGNYDELAKKIIQLVGGESNIANVTHCITRLRFNLKDESKADTEAIRSTPGVVGVTSANGQYQVIIGAEVTQVYEKLTAQLHNAQVLDNKGVHVVLGRVADQVRKGLHLPVGNQGVQRQMHLHAPDVTVFNCVHQGLGGKILCTLPGIEVTAA